MKRTIPATHKTVRVERIGVAEHDDLERLEISCRFSEKHEDWDEAAEGWEVFAALQGEQGTWDKAAEALEHAAVDWRKAGLDDDENGAWRKAANAWERAEQSDKAAVAAENARDWTRAIGLWRSLDREDDLTNALEKAHLWEEAAPRWEKKGDWKRAAKDWERVKEWGKAAAAWEKAEFPVTAADLYERVGNADAVSRLLATVAEKRAEAQRLEVRERFEEAAKQWERVGEIERANLCVRQHNLRLEKERSREVL
jgi:intraflagellar transport protein 172